MKVMEMMGFTLLGLPPQPSLLQSEGSTYRYPPGACLAKALALSIRSQHSHHAPTLDTNGYLETWTWRRE